MKLANGKYARHVPIHVVKHFRKMKVSVNLGNREDNATFNGAVIQIIVMQSRDGNRQMNVKPSENILQHQPYPDLGRS
jgi:hypothetical protein